MFERVLNMSLEICSFHSSILPTSRAQTMTNDKNCERVIFNKFSHQGKLLKLKIEKLNPSKLVLTKHQNSTRLNSNSILKTRHFD